MAEQGHAGAPDVGAVPSPAARPAVTWTSALVFVAELLAWVGVGLAVAQGVPGPWGVVAGIGASAVAILLWALYAAPRAPLRTPAKNLAVRLMVYALGLSGWLLAGHQAVAAVLAVCLALGEGGERRRAMLARVRR